jgi:hypothetical protein
MRKSSILIGLVVLTLALPLAVFASHQFTDVPDSNQFHNSIDWMKDNNITVGCNPPANTRYCPSDNVTRGQMAAFMKRLGDRSVATSNTHDWFGGSNITLSATGTRIAETSITAPAAGSLLLIGAAGVGNSTTGGSLFSVWLQVDDGPCVIASASPANFVPGAVTYASPATAQEDASTSVTGLVAVTAGAHTVTLCGANDSGSGFSFNSSVVAQFIGVGATSALAGLSSDGTGGPQG